jgi:hypothetical protein
MMMVLMMVKNKIYVRIDPYEVELFEGENITAFIDNNGILIVKNKDSTDKAAEFKVWLYWRKG